MSGKDIFDLSGKVSLVTGGSSGLGKVFCEALAEKGSDVVFSYNTNEAGARETSEMITGLGQKALAIKADIASPDEIRSMFRQVEQEFGKLDVQINNAGMDVPSRRIHELPLDVWNKMINTNLTGLFICLQEGLKIMLKQKSGSIINNASILGLGGSNPLIQDSSGYITCKHGIIGLTRQAAMEYAKDGIRINAIAPGFFPSRIGRNSNATKERVTEISESIRKFTPMGRRGDPSEMKGIVVYLASNAASYVTGSVSVVDGGYTIW